MSLPSTPRPSRVARGALGGAVLTALAFVTLLGLCRSARAELTAASFVPADAMQRYDAIGVHDARNRVYEMFSEDILAPEGADWFDDGTILVYQTNDGRFGKLVVARHSTSLYLRWVTWSGTQRVYSERVAAFRINQSYTFDLDAGVLAPAAGEADFRWAAVFDGEPGEMRFEPRNGARFAFYEFALDWFSIPASIMRTTPATRTSVTNYEVAQDTPIICRTSDGRLSKFVLYPSWRPTQSSLNLEFLTRNADGTFRNRAYAAPYTTTVVVDTIFGPRLAWRRIDIATVDFDAPATNVSGQGEDLSGWGFSSSWSISAQSGAAFAIYGGESPDLGYETIARDFIASQTLSTSEIDASLLTPGTTVLYRTAQGRLGKLQIVSSGYDLVVKYRTFSTSTTTWRADARFVVPGTASCDLDIGLGSVDYFSPHGDFRWAPITSTVRRLQPRNGARFAVVPRNTQTLFPTSGELTVDGYLDDVVKLEPRLVVGGAVFNPGEEAPTQFIRGDVDGDGTLDPGDSQELLEFLEGLASAPRCMDAADVDDDGDVDQSDALFLLSVLTSGSIPVPAPYPSCGIDPSEDELGCESSACAD